MGEDKLKLCPFCGSDNVKLRAIDPEFLVVTCDVCNADGGYSDAADTSTREEAIAAWNTRSEGLQPPVVEVDEKVFSSLGASKAPSSVSAGVAETPSGGWQSMETAPRDGTSILIDDRHQGVVIGWWETGREFSGSPHFNDWCSGHNTAGGYDAGFERIHQPLGWVPLPSRQTSGGEA